MLNNNTYTSSYFLKYKIINYIYRKIFRIDFTIYNGERMLTAFRFLFISVLKPCLLGTKKPPDKLRRFLLSLQMFL